MFTTLLAWHDGRFGWGPGPWWPFMWFIVWGAVIAAAVYWSRRRSPRRKAETLLTERYARGDIDENEYRSRQAVLREKGARS
ncbi:MAG: SHOCT domain-containing protein [Acidimicrobiales bacterium]